MKKLIFISLFLFICRFSPAQELYLEITIEPPRTDKDIRILDRIIYWDMNLIHQTVTFNDSVWSMSIHNISCKINESDYKLIVDYIEVVGLNKNITVTPQWLDSQGFDTLENIQISISLDSSKYKTEIYAYKSMLNQDNNYKKVILFIDLLRSMMTECEEVK
ncbi:MAG: hypothetical protein EHM58_15100 [Ignavibacteriae bacterium]|nr:MAG: hypothetical protein EHM58_15100 [Ignavibacteriota bacterium]